MYSLDEDQKFNRILSAYKTCFSELFGAEPLVTTDDKEAAKTLSKHAALKASQIDTLIAAYLSIEDDWLKKQGFPLRLLVKEYNKILMSVAGTKSKQVWVVGTTESGKPVLSYNKNELKGTPHFIEPLTTHQWELKNPEWVSKYGPLILKSKKDFEDAGVIQ